MYNYNVLSYYNGVNTKTKNTIRNHNHNKISNWSLGPIYEVAGYLQGFLTCKWCRAFRLNFIYLKPYYWKFGHSLYIKRTLSGVPKLTSYIFLYNGPLFSGHVLLSRLLGRSRRCPLNRSFTVSASRLPSTGLFGADTVPLLHPHKILSDVNLFPGAFSFSRAKWYIMVLWQKYPSLPREGPIFLPFWISLECPDEHLCQVWCLYSKVPKKKTVAEPLYYLIWHTESWNLTCRIFKIQDFTCRILKMRDLTCRILKIQDLTCRILKIRDVKNRILKIRDLIYRILKFQDLTRRILNVWHAESSKFTEIWQTESWKFEIWHTESWINFKIWHAKSWNFKVWHAGSWNFKIWHAESRKFQYLTCRILKIQDLTCRILKIRDLTCRTLNIQDLTCRILKLFLVYAISSPSSISSATTSITSSATFYFIGPIFSFLYRIRMMSQTIKPTNRAFSARHHSRGFNNLVLSIALIIRSSRIRSSSFWSFQPPCIS